MQHAQIGHYMFLNTVQMADLVGPPSWSRSTSTSRFSHITGKPTELLSSSRHLSNQTCCLAADRHKLPAPAIYFSTQPQLFSHPTIAYACPAVGMLSLLIDSLQQRPNPNEKDLRTSAEAPSSMKYSSVQDTVSASNHLLSNCPREQLRQHIPVAHYEPRSWTQGAASLHPRHHYSLRNRTSHQVIGLYARNGSHTQDQTCAAHTLLVWSCGRSPELAYSAALFHSLSEQLLLDSVTPHFPPHSLASKQSRRLPLRVHITLWTAAPSRTDAHMVIALSMPKVIIQRDPYPTELVERFPNLRAPKSEECYTLVRNHNQHSLRYILTKLLLSLQKPLKRNIVQRHTDFVVCFSDLYVPFRVLRRQPLVSSFRCVKIQRRINRIGIRKNCVVLLDFHLQILFCIEPSLRLSICEVSWRPKTWRILNKESVNSRLPICGSVHLAKIFRHESEKGPREPHTVDVVTVLVRNSAIDMDRRRGCGLHEGYSI